MGVDLGRLHGLRMTSNRNANISACRLTRSDSRLANSTCKTVATGGDHTKRGERPAPLIPKLCLQEVPATARFRREIRRLAMARPRQPTPDASVRRPIGRRAQLWPDMAPRTTTVEDGAYAQRLGCAHFAHLRAVIEDLSPTRPHSTAWPQTCRPAGTTAALGGSSHPVPNRERPQSA